MQIIVFWECVARRFKIFIIESEVKESSPVVGYKCERRRKEQIMTSSSKRTLGFDNSSVAIDNNFCCPPEIPLIKIFPTIVCNADSKPTTDATE